MTIIAWDGKTLAADSMTTDKLSGQCYQSLKIQRLIRPVKLDAKSNTIITAVCAAGNRAITGGIVKAIVTLKHGSLTGFLRRREELGAYWPDWKSCQIGLVGMDGDEPFFGVIQQGRVRKALRAAVLGVTDTPIDMFVTALDSPAEYVFTILHLYPDSCGGSIVSYDPLTDTLSFVDASDFNPEKIKSKLTSALNDYLSKVDDRSNLRYSPPTVVDESETSEDEEKGNE